MTLGSKSTKTALGTCFPAPVSLKKVEKLSSPALAASTGIVPSGCRPESKKNYNCIISIQSLTHRAQGSRAPSRHCPSGIRPGRRERRCILSWWVLEGFVGLEIVRGIWLNQVQFAMRLEQVSNFHSLELFLKI